MIHAPSIQRAWVPTEGGRLGAGRRRALPRPSARDSSTGCIGHECGAQLWRGRTRHRRPSTLKSGVPQAALSPAHETSSGRGRAICSIGTTLQARERSPLCGQQVRGSKGGSAGRRLPLCWFGMAGAGADVLGRTVATPLNRQWDATTSDDRNRRRPAARARTDRRDCFHRPVASARAIA